MIELTLLNDRLFMLNLASVESIHATPEGTKLYLIRTVMTAIRNDGLDHHHEEAAIYVKETYDIVKILVARAR